MIMVMIYYITIIFPDDHMLLYNKSLQSLIIKNMDKNREFDYLRVHWRYPIKN